MEEQTIPDSVEMIVGNEDQIRAELERCRVQAEVITEQRYSDVEKAKFAKVIRDFNDMYYKLKVQTWCNTKWREVPVCKTPTDLWIYQELIHAIRPDLIIETGSFAGGSALYMRDVMKLSDIPGWVISIDIEPKNIHQNAKDASGIKFLKESSIDLNAVAFVKAHIAAYNAKKIMVILDSDHEYAHVLRELRLYAPLVSVGSALIVEDTNNHPGPKAAVEEWFIEQEEYSYRFNHDYMCEKFMLTFNRDGYFERVK